MGKGLDTHDEIRESLYAAISEVVVLQAGGRECSVCSETQCENNNHMRYWIEGEPTCALIHVLTAWAMHTYYHTYYICTHLCHGPTCVHVCTQHSYVLAYASMCRSYIHRTAGSEALGI